MVWSIGFSEPGEPATALRVLETEAAAAPGPNDVLVRVSAFPLHPGDLHAVERAGSGGFGATVAGMEATGVVVSAGSEARTATGPVAAGDRVSFFPHSGAWQEYVVVPAELVAEVPDGVTDDVAVQMLCNPLTAMSLLRAGGELVDHDVVVQTAATSSVAGLAAFIAHERGISTIGLVRDMRGVRALADRLPGIRAISTDETDWVEQVRWHADGQPIRAALDAVGGRVAGELIRLLAPGGTLVSFGTLAAEPIDIQAASLVFGALAIRGVNITRWPTDTSWTRRVRDVAAAIALADRAADEFVVAARYGLDDLRIAVEHALQPGKLGTVVVEAR